MIFLRRFTLNKRWYDQNPTLSMAVSFLQNTTPQHRELTTAHFRRKISENYPDIGNQVTKEAQGFWLLIQKRRSMDQEAWALVEMMRFLPDDEMETFAVELIRYIYRLENNGHVSDDVDLLAMSPPLNMEAAM
jgi:hypothetical protein